MLQLHSIEFFLSYVIIGLSMKRRKERGVLCKLDIEKAYDQINRSFLLDVLIKTGFGSKWIAWINWCISMVSFSVLVNGSPSGYFRSSRGLRQGDPLSPYLFVLGMEVFSTLIDGVAVGGFLTGYKVRGRYGEDLKITHLLFADDTLVFCQDSTELMIFLRWILVWFEALSGLKINLDKSSILPMGDGESLARKLGCKVGELPLT